MASPRPAKPVISFEEVKKLNPDGQLDINATLGEIVKVTYNQHPSETLLGNAKIKIQGNLHVDVSVRENLTVVQIESDNPVDCISLHWLDPWLDTVINKSYESNLVFTADFYRFERHFILPFVAEFKAYLSGQHPLEYLILKHFQWFMQYNQEMLPFDAKETPYLEEKTGDVVLTLLDGKKVVGRNEINNVSPGGGFTSPLAERLAMLYLLEDNRKYELRSPMHEGSFIEIIMAETAKYIAVNSDKKSDEPAIPKNRNLYYLYLLAAAYRIYKEDLKFACFFEPFRKEFVNHIVNVLLPLVKAEELIETRSAPGPIKLLKEGRQCLYSGTTPFHNLIALADSDILKGVLAELKKDIVNINHLNPLLSIPEAIQLSLIERRILLTQFFDVGMRFTPELAKTLRLTRRFGWNADEVQEIYDARNVAPEPVLTVIAEDEQKPAINFNHAVKLTADKKLDVAATIGEIIKQTLNQSEEKPQIRGALKARLDGFDVHIESDNENDCLAQLIPLMGKFTRAASFSILTKLFSLDRHFIFPYLEDFRKQLAGQHPLECFLLSELRASLQENASQFSSEKPPYLDEKTGELTVTLADHTVIQGHLNLLMRLISTDVDMFCRQRIRIFSIFKDLKKYDYVFEKGALEKAFQSEVVKEYRGIRSYVDERLYQLSFIHWIFNTFGTLFGRDDQYASLTEGVKKVIVNKVVYCLLPTVKAEDLILSDIVEEGMNLPDRLVFNSMLAKMRQDYVNWNTYFGIIHPLRWFSSSHNRSRISSQPLDKKRWFIGRFFEEGLVITPEIFKEMSARFYSESEVQLIFSEFYPRYRRIVDAVLFVLTRDVSGIVMRYLVCDAFVDKAVQDQSAVLVQVSQNRHGFHASSPKSSTPSAPPVVLPEEHDSQPARAAIGLP